MRDGYHLKMLLYVLDELFYIYSQVKNLQRADKMVILAYEILCLSANRCTDWWVGIKKTSMPDALAHHLKHLAWVVYDGALLVGPWPELEGNCPWCMVLSRLQMHIYRGCDDVAHCPPHTLGSWDCQEWIDMLQQEGGLSSA